MLKQKQLPFENSLVIFVSQWGSQFLYSDSIGILI